MAETQSSQVVRIDMNQTNHKCFILRMEETEEMVAHSLNKMDFSKRARIDPKIKEGKVVSKK